MSTRNLTSQQRRLTRHARVRATVIGTPAKPRLNVHRSLTGMFLQIIDDAAGKTLVSASTKDLAKESKKMDAAKILGTEMAKRAKAAGIKAVVFDRGGFRYTGRVATLADAARAGGLKL